MTAKLTQEWVGFLPQAVASYNNSYHRGIKQKPIDVNTNNEDAVWKEMYKTASDQADSHHQIDKSFAFKVGDDVRMSHLRRAFQREYQERWTREYFIITEREMRSGIPTYKLKDWQNEEILGSFYTNELQAVKVNPNAKYIIQEILKERGKGRKRESLVHWLGWPHKFDSWLPTASIKNIQRAE